MSVVLLLTLLLLIGLTILGNLLVCLSVILVKKLRKPQNYLLVSLALSDLFVAVFVMPLAAVSELSQEWPLGESLCDLWVSGDVLLCTSSILNLCAISVDRYRAITRPLEYSHYSSPHRMLFFIFLVWFGSACVSLPPVLLLGNEYKLPDGTLACNISQNYWYQLYATMISFYVPLGVMITVYLKILRVVKSKNKEMEHQIVQVKTLQIGATRPSRDHKASTTLGIIMSAFIICWLPFFLLALVRPLFLDDTYIPPIIPSIFLWLGYANSCFNPIIYATLNRDFRRPFREILCCRCATLDSLMRREFYDAQFGPDEHRVSKVCVEFDY